MDPTVSADYGGGRLGDRFGDSTAARTSRRRGTLLPGSTINPAIISAADDVSKDTTLKGGKRDSVLKLGNVNSVLVNEGTFKDGFSLERFVSDIMKDVLRTKRYDPKGLEVSAAATASKLSLDKVHKLLKTFDKISADLAELQESVVHSTSELQSNVQMEESHYKVELKVTEKSLDRIRETFKDLDAKTVRVSQTTTRIGDRLQTAETMRQRAQDLVKLVEHLQSFINLPAGDFSQLPPFFLDDATLSEAASVVRRLLLMAKGAQTTTAQTRTAENSMSSPKADAAASIEATIRNLEEYCAMLEQRIMERFDEGAEEKSLKKMAQCAAIMGEFDRERTVIQRYVSSRPVLLDTGDAEKLMGDSLSSATDIQGRLKPLQYLHRDMLQLLKEEAAIIPEVFPSPKLALDLLLQTLVEQRISPVLDRLLASPGVKGDSAALQAWLNLLSEAYERTLNFTSAVEKYTGNLLDTSNICLDLFAHHLSDYPMPELYWLHKIFEQVVRETDSAELKPEAAKKLMTANHESVKRCVKLSSPSMVSRNVRMLFYSGQNVVAAGCLLEHLSRYVTAGLTYATDLCVQGSMPSLASTGLTNLTSSLAAQLAETYVSDRVSWVLQACSTASTIVQQLQQHYSTCIVPHVSSSLMDHATCNQGMVTHVKSMESAVVTMLSRCLDAFLGQVDRVLVTEQRKLDFCPRDVDMLMFDKPTNACLLVTAMLRALKRQAVEHLKGTNLTAFLTEAGQRMFEALLTHMQRFVYSATGALKWKSDVSVYAECINDFDIVAVNEKFKQLQSIVNVLVVGPESLLGLVDGTLRMSHADVLKYIMLREDYKTTRINGMTLQQLFTSESVMNVPTFGLGLKK